MKCASDSAFEVINTFLIWVMLCLILTVQQVGNYSLLFSSRWWHSTSVLLLLLELSDIYIWECIFSNFYLLCHRGHRCSHCHCYPSSNTALSVHCLHEVQPIHPQMHRCVDPSGVLSYPGKEPLMGYGCPTGCKLEGQDERKDSCCHDVDVTPKYHWFLKRGKWSDCP